VQDGQWKVKTFRNYHRFSDRHPETEFVGLDLSQPMLERAEANAKASGVKNVKFKKIDFSTLEGIPDASIDAVISTFAIHHLPSKKHLENLFVNAKRVLKSGGRLFIFDFGRLKTIQSVIHFAYRDRKRLPYLFTLDIERSIRASFLLEEFKELGQKYFGSKVTAWGTFKVPLMIMVRSASQYLSESIRNFYRETRLKLTVSQRNDLDDLRAFFKLSGFSDDPFKVFFPENYFQARVKMIRMSSLGVQSFILIQRSFRLLILFIMFVRIGLCVFGAGVVKIVGNQEKANRAERWANHKIGIIAAETLGGLKGAVMKFGQMLSFFPVGLPKEITGHLDVLQDSVIPLSGSSIKRQIEESLGRPITQLFSEWNDTPLAAASVGQVHFAKLMDGRPVAVKVKFRQIEEIIDGDLKNILLFAPWLKKRTGVQ
jgi:ubiquinone/menaquinone biosynthesis C-methylase UbiE